MSTADLAQQVSDLTTATNELLNEVVGQKDRLTTAADNATEGSNEARDSELAAKNSKLEAAASAAEAKTEADRASEVSGLDTVEQAVDVALGEFAGLMSESEARAINRSNEAKYAASGFVHMGNRYGSLSYAVNEGIYAQAASPNVFKMGSSYRPQGTSKTDFAVAHIAGAVSNMNKLDSLFASEAVFKLPEAEDGTRIYDSTGDARGTGKANLDLKVDVDPKYGDVASDTNEAVARAFEGSVKNGDFRDGTNNGWIQSGSGWSSAYENGALRVTSVGGWGRVRIGTTGINTNENVIVEFTVVEENNGGGQVHIGLGSAYSPDSPYTIIAPGSGARRYRLETTPTSGTYLSIRGSVSSVTANMLITDISIKPVTEEVVTNPVDLMMLEYYEEELTGRQEVFECIQSLSTTFGDTDVPTVLSTRPLSYFQQYDGQFPDPSLQNDQYRCVVWSDLTDEQKRKVAAYMGEKLFVGENGLLVNGRLRARTIRGLGNGDWNRISSTEHDLRFGTQLYSYLMGQGVRDSVPPPNWQLTYLGVSHPANTHPIQGTFTLSDDARQYKGRCFALVVGTVPRLNQGAYHPSLNVSGCRKFRVSPTSGSSNFWYKLADENTPKTSLDCFVKMVFNDPVNTVGYHVSSGRIGFDSGRDDSRLYDAIYPDGLGGVVDYRLSAHDMSAPHEASKVWEKVKNGTYRGEEKLVFTHVEPQQTSHTITTASDGLQYADHTLTFRTTLSSPTTTALPQWKYAKVVGDNGGSIILERDARLADAAFSSTGRWPYSNNYCYLMNVKNLTSKLTEFNTAFAVGTTLTLTLIAEEETNLSVSGEYSFTDVIGDPANILQTDALKDGWLGSWIPAIPKGTGTQVTYTYTREALEALIDVQYSDTLGVTWADAHANIDTTTNSTTGGWPAERVRIATYTAFAKQTKPSTNKPVLNGEAGLIGIITTQDHNKSTFAESVANVILKSGSSGVITERSQPIKYLIDGVIERVKTLQTDLASPSNDSQAIKVAVYQVSKNGQLFLGFIANTMTHNGTDWGELDEIIIPFGSLEVDSFNDANGIAQLAYSTITALPYGWAKNRARAGEQVEGVDL